MSEDSEDLAFLNHVISRDQNISYNHNWNCVPNNLNTMVQFKLFKKNLTAFLLSLPDTPPTKGYSPSNSNSILAWRVDSSAAALWGGQRS